MLTVLRFCGFANPVTSLLSVPYSHQVPLFSSSKPHKSPQTDLIIFFQCSLLRFCGSVDPVVSLLSEF